MISLEDEQQIASVNGDFKVMCAAQTSLVYELNQASTPASVDEISELRCTMS